MKVKSEREVSQSCLTLLCHRQQPARLLCGIFQARALEWVAIAYSKKDYDRDITPVVEPVKVPAHLVLPGSGSLIAKQIHHFNAQISLGQRCHRQKQKCLVSMHRGSIQ